MRFTRTSIADVWVIEPEFVTDERGHFARLFDRDLFRQRGLISHLVQCSTSFNRRARTLRGLHFQHRPHEEAKLVRCTLGRIWDVAVDLRPSSPTYRRWFGTVLSSENALTLYVPRGCAHGFLTLEDNSEVHYQIDTPYVPGAAGGVRWDDPAIGIDWPAAPVILSDRDASFPDLVT